MSEAFESLKHFIVDKMSMTKVYQPVVIKTLLMGNGRAKDEDLGKALLSEDFSNVEVFTKKFKRYPKTILREHGVIEVSGREVMLTGFDGLSESEKYTLLGLCQEKIEGYPSNAERTGVSRSVSFEVLERAHRRCELCGKPEEVQGLHVDHIVPSSLGGLDDIANLQALCARCNTSKRNRSSADYRQWEETFGYREQGCIFCQLQQSDRVLSENELAISALDNYPVTPGHVLVLPKRHVASFFELHQPEVNAIWALLNDERNRISTTDSEVTGFNVGVNVGESAGQTIFHCHVHLIPRREGDVAEPRGGVRGVIPAKQAY